MLDTEKMLDKIPISKISNDSWNIINEIDIQEWYDRKHRNWNLLQDITNEDVKILQPEKNTFNPFSLVLLFKSKEVRDNIDQSPNCFSRHPLENTGNAKF